MRSPLTHTNCPKCSKAGRHLAAISENAIVDCDSCGHVWAIDKQGARRDVTVTADPKVAS